MESAVRSLREEFGDQHVWVPPPQLFSLLLFYYYFLFFISFFPSFLSPKTVFLDKFSILQTSASESDHPLQGTKCDVREGSDVKALVAFAQEKLKYIDIWVFI